MSQASCLCLCVVLGRNTPWPCSCGRAGTTTACPTITPTRHWGWTVDLWTSCGCPTLSSSTPNLLGSTMSLWRTSWSACSPMESFYTAAGMSKQITVFASQSKTGSLDLHSLYLSAFTLTFTFRSKSTTPYFKLCCLILRNFRHFRARLTCCLWEQKSWMIHTITWE